MASGADSSAEEARALLATARVDYEHERFSDATRRITAARAIYEELDDLLGLANCNQRQAMIASDIGDLSSALQLAQSALSLFEAVRDEAAAAKTQISLGATMIRIQQPKTSLEYTCAAMRFFRVNGSRIDLATCYENMGLAFRRLGRYRTTRRSLQRALRVLEQPQTHVEKVRYADIQMALAGLDAHEGNAESAAQLRNSALATYDALDQPFRRSIQERNIGIAACRDGDFESGKSWFIAARDRLRDIGHSLEAADTSRLIARADLGSNQPTWETMRFALEAVRMLEDHRYELSKPALRESWLRKHLRAHDMACRVAEVTQHPEIVAEIIETTRQQARSSPHGVTVRDLDGRPAALPKRPTRAGEYVRDAITVASGGQPLGPAQPVTVNGWSHIHASEPTNAVDLNRLAATAGRHGWLWGTFVHAKTVWWYLRDPDGNYQSGQVDYSSQSPQRRAVEAFNRHFRSLAENHESARLARGGPLGRKLDKRLFSALTSLLPDQLVDAARSHTPADPLRLSMAHDPELAALPWVLVPLSPETPCITMIDHVQIGLAPPVSLLPLLRHPAQQTDRQIEFAVLDSRNDLPAARSTVRHARYKLTGASATKRAVRRVLATIEPGSSGLTVIATHIAEADTTSPLSTAIVLADGLLTAAEIVDGSTDWGFTDRVHLAGCTSMGLHHREWLGIASAILAAGAHVVTASTWPLLDDRAMRITDRAIIERLRSNSSASGALRDAQMELRLRSRGLRQSQRPLPYHWAAYSAVGHHC